jgi:hypothetical protein
MRPLLLCALLILTLLPAAPARAQAEAATILAPVEGQTVAGTVTIAGQAAGPQFQRYELDFGYEPNPTDTWFPIQDPVVTPQFGGPLAQWDTVAQGIADGVYVLRLRVYRADGTFAESFVHNVILQNGFAAGPADPGLPTPTATGVFVQLPPTSTPRPVVTPRPTETPLPGRAEGSFGPSLNLATFGRAFARGIGWTAFLFVLLGLYAALRPRLRPRLWRLIRRLVKSR